MSSPGFSRIRRLFRSAVIAAALAAAPAHATDNELGIWTIFTTTDRWPTEQGNSRWNYWLDAQARFLDPGSGASQYLVRPAVGYTLQNGMQVWGGYARFRSRGASGGTTDENRFWQQLNWSAGRALGGTVAMRVRLEQRSLSSGDDLGLVLRLMGKYTRPIGNDGLRDLFVSLEPFFDLRDTDWGGDSGIAQNRLAVGVAWRLRPKLTLEVGYMNQYVWRDNRENASNHLAVLNFKKKF